MTNSSTKFRLLVLAWCSSLFLSTLPSLSSAQGKEGTPVGESTSRVLDIRGVYEQVDYNRRSLIVHGFNGFRWSPPGGADIDWASVKPKTYYVIIIALNDGSVYKMKFTFGFGAPSRWSEPELISKGGPPLDKVEGDALYGVSSGIAYISRDTAATWQIDTAGIGPAGYYYYDIALDTLQYVYLAHAHGLFKQHPDTSIWRKVNSFPGTDYLGASSATSVFVDRMNRVFAGRFSNLYKSTDNGSTWTIDTAGLNNNAVTRLCDDQIGNIYARNDTAIWRSTGGTQPWVRIDQPISALVYDRFTSVLFNDISGDSLLYAATVFGAYVSSDHGTTWTRDSFQFSASFIYGLAKTPAGRLLTSTSLGVYYKNPADTQWTKTFPTTGYLAGSPVFLDGSGNAYTLGAKLDPSNFQSFQANWKSTNGGLTWNPDTSGLGGLTGQQPVYFVDEIGTQHFGGYGSPANFYRKVSGQSWTADTSGYGSRSSEYAIVFGTDHHGFFYVATNNLSTYKGMVWKRPIAGGAWTPDTSGLSGTQVYSITADKNGNPIAGAIDGVFRKNGGVWTKLPSPPALGGYSAFVVSVDSSGNTIAGFSTYGFPNYLWRGLYATNNNGTSWSYLGLDSISVRGLVSYGDSTYAYTYADGLYKVRSTGNVSFVGVETRPTSFALEQNYPNPFNPTTTIRFSIAKLSIVNLKIFDILGREVQTLVNGKLEAGLHQSVFDASRFASGVYFYRLQAGNFVSTKKLVLLK